MKKIIFFVVISLLALAGAIYLDFSKPPSNSEPSPTYDTGYEEGKSIGYDIGYDDGFEDGYSDGKSYGYEDGSVSDDAARHFEWEAVDYACENSEWHPEEAWMIIECYKNNDPWYQDGSPPSEQDYYDAIQSLICFYEYFYGGHYAE